MLANAFWASSSASTSAWATGCSRAGIPGIGPRNEGGCGDGVGSVGIVGIALLHERFHSFADQRKRERLIQREPTRRFRRAIFFQPAVPPRLPGWDEDPAVLLERDEL